MATPTIAAPKPMPRNRPGFCRETSAIRLRTGSVNPARSRPSIAKTRPIAAPKSRMSLRRRGCRRLAGRRRRSGEITEEIRLRTEDRARFALEARIVGLHRAIEREKLGVLAVGLGENAVALAIALAADLVGLLLGLGDRHRHLGVGVSLDLLALLRALRAERGGKTLALRLHAMEHRLGILLWQVGALDADVDDLDAEALGPRLHLVADIRHQGIALVAHDVDDRRLGERAPQRRIQHAAELGVGALDVEH